MVTVIQVKDFMTGRVLPVEKQLGSFFSLESAEEKLGKAFIAQACAVLPF